MPATFSILFILLAGFVTAISYQMVTDCASKFVNGNCWDPQQFPTAFVFYLGLTLLVLGVVILVSGDVIKLFRKISD